MSIAGGYYKAVVAAHQAGCDTVQIFTKNNNQWRAKTLTAADVEQFQGHLQRLRIQTPTAHTSYLINLGSPNGALWKRSIDALVVEVQRCDLLGVGYLVLHPGSHMESTLKQGLRRVAQALNEVRRQTPEAKVRILLEVTAGQGTNMGCRFEHLGEIMRRCHDPDRLGVCFDTCHAFAAGYAMGNQREYRETMRALDKAVGLRQVKAFHLNDSKGGLGSRIDRHEHIGRGRMGLEPFRLIVNDARFRKTPMYLETPKGKERGKDLDRLNLRRLRGLVTV